MNKRIKILIINPFGIGDVTFSTPMIEILKKHFPDSYIGYVCNRRTSGLIAANPNLNRIFIYEKDEYRDILRRSKIEFIKKIWAFLGSIRNEKFDISIDLSLTYQYSMFLWLLGIKKRLGFNYRNRGRFLTAKIDTEGFENKHVIDHYLDILKLLDIDVTKYEIKPVIYASRSDLDFAAILLKQNGIRDDDTVIGIIPGCGASWGMDAGYRRWDRGKFAALADLIIEKYRAKIVLLGNCQEKDVCETVAQMMKNKAINYCGKTSIGEFLGILKRCKMVITNDGGPLHMAVGLGIKTISIFGPVDEAIYGPYGNARDHIVLSKKNLSCRPCYRKFKYKKCENKVCLDSIGVEDAAEAVRKILSL